MKSHKITFLFMALFAFFLISLDWNSSEAQTESSTTLLNDSDTFVFVQTFLENSDGQFITYLTSDKFTDLNYSELENLLQTEASENDPIITIDDKKFQIIKRKLTITYDKENVIASTILASSTEGKLNTVARFAHDGYPIIPGDKVHSIWTFVKPLE